MSSSSSSLRLSQLHSRKVLREKEQIKFKKKLWIVTEEIIFLLLKRSMDRDFHSTFRTFPCLFVHYKPTSVQW
ncbi:hypothetical protein IFM89_026068 [Coptis chinensis]|uniref:Uncharacterized protein n=1 Tax=Coptis chinensis TaxID=261450 RepID=A0A835M9J4_9MAGN|nr:hypothetical protein IFM89_026068 [Coptis chinensis]